MRVASGRWASKEEVGDRGRREEEGSGKRREREMNAAVEEKVKEKNTK